MYKLISATALCLVSFYTITMCAPQCPVTGGADMNVGEWIESGLYLWTCTEDGWTTVSLTKVAQCPVTGGRDYNVGESIKNGLYLWTCTDDGWTKKAVGKIHTRHFYFKLTFSIHFH